MIATLRKVFSGLAMAAVAIAAGAQVSLLVLQQTGSPSAVLNGLTSAHVQIGNVVALSANTTVAAGVYLEFKQGGQINCNGFTLTINGGFWSPVYNQAFTNCANLVTITSPQEVHTNWWSLTDFGQGTNAALLAFPHYSGNGTYSSGGAANIIVDFNPLSATTTTPIICGTPANLIFQSGVYVSNMPTGLPSIQQIDGGCLIKVASGAGQSSATTQWTGGAVIQQQTGGGPVIQSVPLTGSSGSGSPHIDGLKVDGFNQAGVGLLIGAFATTITGCSISATSNPNTLTCPANSFLPTHNMENITVSGAGTGGTTLNTNIGPIGTAQSGYVSATTVTLINPALTTNASATVVIGPTPAAQSHIFRGMQIVGVTTGIQAAGGVGEPWGNIRLENVNVGTDTHLLNPVSFALDFTQAPGIGLWIQGGVFTATTTPLQVGPAHTDSGRQVSTVGISGSIFQTVGAAAGSGIIFGDVSSASIENNTYIEHEAANSISSPQAPLQIGIPAKTDSTITMGSGSQAVTATDNPFLASDVGDNFSGCGVTGSSVPTITSFTDSNHVTVSAASGAGCGPNATITYGGGAAKNVEVHDAFIYGGGHSANDVTVNNPWTTYQSIYGNTLFTYTSNAVQSNVSSSLGSFYRNQGGGSTPVSNLAGWQFVTNCFSTSVPCRLTADSAQFSSATSISSSSRVISDANDRFQLDTAGATRAGNGTSAPVALSGFRVENGAGNAPTAITVTGDGTLSTAGALTVTKTSGVAFAPSATTDTTNAANISSGSLAAARFPVSNTSTAGAVFGLGFLSGAGVYSAPLSIASAANTVYACQFIMPVSVTIGHAAIYISTGSSGAFENVALYNASGALLFDSGGFLTTATGNFSKSATQVTIFAGTPVYMAWATSATGVANQALQLSGNSGSLLNTGTAMCGSAANAPSNQGTSSQAMPSTLGTITAVTMGSTTWPPLVKWSW